MAQQNNRVGIEVMIDTANRYLTQRKPVEARNLLVKAKMRAIDGGIDDLVHAANRSLAVSHLNEANDMYTAGNLDGAFRKYPEAENAYTKFKDSFDKQTLLQHLGMLYDPWVSAALQLGQKAHVEGSNQLSSSNNAAEAVLAALGRWDVALKLYAKTIEIHEKAKQKGVNLPTEFKTVAEQEIGNIKPAAAQWANSISKPEVAEKYLL